MEALSALGSLGAALLLTVATEAAVGWLLGLRTRRAQLLLLLINTVTNPLLNLLLGSLAFFGIILVRSPFDPLVIALECVVIAAEAALLRATLRLPIGRSALVSALTNGASWLLGVLILWR
jgi:hypothetical protein